MIRQRLDEAIQLREEGRAKQDRDILGKALEILFELEAAHPDQAEVLYQLGVAHDNSGLGREAIPYYVKALELGLTGPDLERCLMGLGSTYRALGFYQEAVETLRRGMREFPDNRAIQIFLSIALYNTQSYKEAMELALTHLLETTTDEKLQYFGRGLSYYAKHLDETW